MKNQTTRRILAILLALVLTLGLLPTSAFAARVADDEVQTTAPVEDATEQQANALAVYGTRTPNVRIVFSDGKTMPSSGYATGKSFTYDTLSGTTVLSPSSYYAAAANYTFLYYSCRDGGGIGTSSVSQPGDWWNPSGTIYMDIHVKESSTGGSSSGGSGSGSSSGASGSHSVACTFTVLYVDSSFNIGYNYGDSYSTTFNCQYSNCSTTGAYSSHCIAISDIGAARSHVSVNSGYSIVGWTKSASANPSISTTWTGTGYGSGGTTLQKSGTIYLVAKRSNSSYTITYNANGGSGAPGNTYTESNTSSTKSGTLSSSKPSRSNYTFLGWSTNQYATSASYAAGGTYNFTSDTPLYAVWQKVESKTITVKKVFAGLTSEQVDAFTGDFAIVYNLHKGSQTGVVLASSALMLLDDGASFDEDTMTAAWTISYENPTSATLYLELTEYGGDVANYTYTPTSSTGDSFTKNGDAYTTFITVNGSAGNLTRTITNTYTKMITVTWLDAEGTQIKQETIPEGEDYEDLYPTDQSTTGDWGAPVTDHETGNITIRWVEPTAATANYTVQWYDTLGNVLKTPETRPGTVDETVSVTGADKTVANYDFVATDSRNVTSATLAESGTVLKLYFQPKKPTSPDYSFLYNLAEAATTLQCQDKESHQRSHRLTANTAGTDWAWTSWDEAVRTENNAYKWDMVIDAERYLELCYSSHELCEDQAKTVTLTFTWNGTAWELPDGTLPVVIEIEGHKTTYTWKDEGDAGHVWKTATVSDCLTAPTYDGTTPTKAADDDYTYTFDRWDGPATTDDSKTYTAVYTPTAIPKLEITKTALVTGSVKPGDEVRYQIMVTNVGNTDVTGVVITDALDSNLEFEGAVGTGKIWDAAPVEGKYDFGERVLGSVNTDTSTITLTITATVADGVANGTTIPNVATVDCPNMPEDNKPSDDANITVGPTNGTVTVKYVTDDETPVELGSVSYEAAIDADYDHSVDNDGTAIPENGSATAKSPKTITTEAGVTYAYDAIATNSALTGTVSDGLVITVVYAADTKGNPGTDDAGEPTDEPDGTPDKYQVKVTFHVVNGFWNDGANADVVEYLEKYTDGVMAADGVATLGDIIPGAGERPISNEYRAGSWDVTPAETTTISADTTYTYTYVAKGHYTVIWLDDDGSVLHPQETVLEGDAIPSKPIPTKEADDDYTYTFSGWDDDVDETTGDVTRTATYTATARPKATVTWVDHDGTVLEGPVTFNTDGDPEPAQTIDDPTEYEDDDNVYTFVNWTRAVDETTGNITYTATYDATPKYTVTWKDGDTTILEGEDKVKGVDDVPEFPGELPEAPEGKEFDRWGDPVVDDETHTITVPIVWKDKDTLTVKWVDEDGTTELTTPKTFFKGEAEPSYDGQTPTKASDATYNYSFKEWVKTTDDQGNITYTASYDATRKSTGGGGGGGSRPVDPPEEDLGDEDVPLAELPMLNQTDHFAYIIGKPDGNVHPLGNITRAEVVTIFFRIMTEEARSENWGEINEFSDVTEGMWYNHAVCTAVNAGLIKGMPDGTFGGDRNITRAEFATIAARFLDTATQPAETFTDIEGHWAEADITRATVAGWIKGVGDGKFNPDAYITRAEVMTLVNRMLNRKFDETNTLADMVVWADNMDKDIWYYGDVQEATNDHEYERKAGTLTETWTKITEPRDWSELEK